jgi:hypothetical protein
MALFRQVYTEFWTDPKTQEEFSVEDKLFFIYLLTNPHAKQIGIYTLTVKQMAFEIGWSIESTKSVLDRFINHHRIIMYNSDTREIAIKNWGKYNLTRGGKPFIDLIIKELKEVKDVELIKYVISSIEKDDIRSLFKESYTVHKEMAKYKGFDDTSTIRERVVPRQGDNNNKNNNKNNNNNKDVTVVVDKIKSYFSLNDEEIEKVVNTFLNANKDITYLIEKLEFVKNTKNVQSVVGYLVSAIEWDYKAKAHIGKPKNGFCNYTENFNQYSEEEFKAIVENSQKAKFG